MDLTRGWGARGRKALEFGWAVSGSDSNGFSDPVGLAGSWSDRPQTSDPSMEALEWYAPSCSRKVVRTSASSSES